MYVCVCVWIDRLSFISEDYQKRNKSFKRH